MKPKITLIMVTTADGVIANTTHEDSFTWNSKEDKQHFRKLSKEIGTLILGSTTYIAAGGASLKDRLNIVLTSRPDEFEPHPNAVFMSGTPQDVVDLLSEREVAQAALIGGANVNRQFLLAGLVDELVLTLEPKLFGTGLRLSEDAELEIDMKLEESTVLNEQGTMLLRYSLLNQDDSE